MPASSRATGRPSSDAARLPYATTSLALGEADVSALVARHEELDVVLREAEEAQRMLGAAETQLASLRSTIERRLAEAEASVRDDANALAVVEQERKRYSGTVDRVAGATRAI